MHRVEGLQTRLVGPKKMASLKRQRLHRVAFLFDRTFFDRTDQTLHSLF
jgi:hypothetical protein